MGVFWQCQRKLDPKMRDSVYQLPHVVQADQGTHKDLYNSWGLDTWALPSQTSLVPWGTENQFTITLDADHKL